MRKPRRRLLQQRPGIYKHERLPPCYSGDRMDYDFRRPSTDQPVQRPVQPPTTAAAPPDAVPPVLLAQTAPDPEEPRTGGSGGPPSAFSELLSTIGILGTALLVALLMIAFVFRSYQVDGPSMMPTLQNGDKLIIWKVPRTWASITNESYIPNRGDIVVFNQAGLSEFGQNDNKQLIKRVIGIPGDTVVLKNNHYTVFNDENPNGFDPDQTLGYGDNLPLTSGDNTWTVREGQIFVSGDNRPNSLDSRSFGPIQAKQVVGKLILRVFPINKAEVY